MIARSLVAVAVVAAVPSAAADFEWSGAIAPGQTLEIIGISGDIDARGTPGNAAVEADKHGRDADEVEIRVETHSGGVTICAVYPSRSGGRSSGCENRRRHKRDTRASVDFDVSVPEGVILRARTVNGDVRADRLTADTYVSTVNGSIEASSTGEVEAETVNGSIRADLGRFDGDAPLRFSTVNGSITLSLPEGIGANLEARTVNGEIESDFPMAVRGRISRRRVEATLGGGGRELELVTVNGSIRLRRGA